MECEKCEETVTADKEGHYLSLGFRFCYKCYSANEGLIIMECQQCANKIEEHESHYLYLGFRFCFDCSSTKSDYWKKTAAKINKSKAASTS